MKKVFKILISINVGVIALMVFAVFPCSVHAAKVSFDAATTSISRNQESVIKIVLHTEGETINAISGTVVVPKGMEVVRIQDGDSAILLWIEKPVFNKDDGTIIFSGITPGGILGDKTVFSLIVKSETAGKFALSLSKISANKNDGNGSEVKITSSPTQLVIGTNSLSSAISTDDNVPPEIFVPIITKSPDLFENKPFISFLTQDKGVGMDHFEYTAGFLSPANDGWSTIQSPSVLPKDSLNKKIFIKAVDKSGNERVVSVTGPGYYVNVFMWVIIIILIVCVPFILKRLFSR